MARLLHAEADDVAVTTSVSQGVSALVSALPLDGERNRIVISEYEFPTVGQIAHAQELRGAEVVHVRPDDDGGISPERFAEAIDERTALVCCTTISYRSGHRHDVAEIAEAAHARGRARARRQLPGLRRRGARRADARRRRRHGRHRQVPARDGRPRLHVAPARGLRAARPDADRLVRRRGHLRDVDRRLLAAPERAPLRLRDAAGPRALCRGRRRRDRRGGRRPRRSRHTCAAWSIDSSTGWTSSAPPSRRRATPHGAARSSAFARPTSPPSSRRSPTRRSSSPSARTSCASRSTSTTSRTTSTGSSTRSRRHRALLA